MTTADLLTIKLLLNIMIATKGARFMTIDIKNFYLNTPLTRFDYLKMRLCDFSEDFIEHYGLKDKAMSDGYVCVEVRKGIHGLPHAGRLAQ